jgi:hypothetical protein
VTSVRKLWRWWRNSARLDIWNVGVVMLAEPLRAVEALPKLLLNVKWLPPQPPLYYVADPFPYCQGGREWLLVEQYGHPHGVRGRICRLDPSSATPVLVPVIDRPNHLSYPYVVTDDDGRTWCVPEMAEARDGCVLFELTPDGSWMERARILAGRVVFDPTIFRFGERWWLLCGNAQGRGNLELEAYYADAIGGPWTPHPLNPLKRDRASARPGGRPFVIGGQLFRPAQDCSRTYGGALTILAVDELTPTTFGERPVLRLEPDPRGRYRDGLHHLVVGDDRIYIDGKWQRYDYWLWLKRWRAAQPERERRQ